MASLLNLLLPLLSLTSLSLAAQQEILGSNNACPFDSQFEKLVNETLDMWHVPGLSIAVVDGDDMWAEGYGIASYPDTKVMPSTLFYAGSTTKAFTAAVMSLLVDDNEKYPEVQWRTPVSHLIRDDFVLEDEYATTHITIEDILSHRTGLPRHDFSYGGHSDGHKARAVDVVRSLRYLPLTAEPRTRFQYCNLMFVLASHVIESLTGRWLGDLVHEWIWKPLDMKSTYFSTPAAKDAPEDLAQGYVYYKGEYRPVPFMDLDVVSGAGSVISNVLDYSKWLKALLDQSGPISKEGYKALLSARTIVDRDEDHRLPPPFTGTQTYSLGWQHSVYKGYEFYEHGGGMEAFGAQVIFFPALNYGLATFGNTAATSNMAEERLMWHLIDDKLGIPEKERFDWNKYNQGKMLKKIERYEQAAEQFYPWERRPNPPLAPTLPLKNYTGTYRHPAYNNVTIFLEDGDLHINRQDGAWKIRVDFDHITGDYFMAYLDSTTAPGLVFREAVPAEFKVGSDGVSKSFGIIAEPEMNGEKIWFDRL